MRVISLAAAALLLAACAAVETPAPAPAPAVELDADPNSLQIEIGRYSALLGQVVEHTGVAYEHAAHDDNVPEGAPALMAQLKGAIDDYNAVRAALCASNTKVDDPYVAIRSNSCIARYNPRWAPATPTFDLVAKRSHEAGSFIISLWSDVCDRARQLQPKDQEDEPVCPME